MCQLSSLKTSPGLVSLPGSVQLLHKIMNARTAEAAGINRFKILVIINIDMWHHPKYYKELRKLRNKLDQAISKDASTEATSVRPGPGLKRQASSGKQQAIEEEASSSKSSKL